MVETHIALIGHVTGTLTTLSFLPQVIKAWRTRSTGGLSPDMLPVFLAGIALWLVYGLSLGAMPLILANSVTLVLVPLLRLRLGLLR